MLLILAVWGVVRESRKFSGHPCKGALRGHLCYSTAFFNCFPSGGRVGLGGLVEYRDGRPTRERSPISVVTRLGVEQLR